MADPAVHVEGVVKRFGATKALAGVDLDSRRAPSSGCSGRTARDRVFGTAPRRGVKE